MCDKVTIARNKRSRAPKGHHIHIRGPKIHFGKWRSGVRKVAK